MWACTAGAEEAIPAIFQGCKIRTDIGVMAIVVGDPNPFVLGHRLVRDGIMDVGVLRALGEHSQMLAQGHQGGHSSLPRRGGTEEKTVEEGLWHLARAIE